MKFFYHQAVAAIERASQKADAFLSTYEDRFKQQNILGKVGIVITVLGAATVIPGGYIALELWGVRKLLLWARRKFRI